MFTNYLIKKLIIKLIEKRKMHNDEFIEEDEDNIDTYDSDKDAEYHLPGVSNGKIDYII